VPAPVPAPVLEAEEAAPAPEAEEAEEAEAPAPVELALLQKYGGVSARGFSSLAAAMESVLAGSTIKQLQKILSALCVTPKGTDQDELREQLREHYRQ
jgi:hypothetical protein